MAQTFSKVQIKKFEDDAIANVYAIEMDNQHFIWLATQNGIFRFDSRSFEKIPVKQTNGENAEWTAIGAICYQPASNRLVVMSPDKGLAVLMREADSLHFKEVHLPASIEAKDIKRLTRAGNDFALLTDRGLYIIDINPYQTRQVTVLHTINRPYLSINSPSPAKICGLTANGTIDTLYRAASGQWSSGSLPASDKKNLFDPGDEIFDFVSVDSVFYVGTSRGLVIYRAGAKEVTAEKRFSDTIIHAITPLAPNLIAVASSRGLYFSRPGGAFEKITSMYSPENNHWFNSTYALFAEKTGNLWLGSQNGLALLKQKPDPFIKLTGSNDGKYRIGQTYHILRKKDGSLIISASNGLSVADRQLQVTPLFEDETFFLSFEGPDNQLFVSDRNNTYILNGHRLIPCGQRFPELLPFEEFSFNDVEAIGDSCLMLSTENYKGVVIWNYKKRQARHLATQANPPLSQTNSLFQYEGQIYILTDNFIYRYDPVKGTLNSFRIQQPGRTDYYALFFDMVALHNRFYITSYGSGVIETDQQFRVIQTINEKKGLTDNGTYKLFVTDSNTIFVSSNHGINLIHFPDLTIENLTADDGLHGNLFEEFSGLLSNNLLYFGGKGGLTLIDPTLLDFAPNRGHFVFTKYTTADNRNSLQTYSLIDRSAISIENNVAQTTLYFQNILYPGNSRIRYAYKINGINDDWIDLGNQNFLNLIGIAPGNYTVHVRSTDDQGNWQEANALSVSILPKWHQTWWFKLVLLSMALGCIYIIYRVRINQLKQTQAIRTKLAGDLHDDLGSTLNSVKVYANLALMEKDSNKHAGKIKESIQEAITGLRDMIWVLDDRKDTLEDLTGRIRQFAAPLCEASGIRYIEDLDNEARSYRLNSEEKRNLYMILKEAINNSLKYADASEIKVSVRITGHKNPEISCSDNGKGFEHSTTQSGNGLANMQRRARQLRYQLIMQSANGEGSSITLRKA